MCNDTSNQASLAEFWGLLAAWSQATFGEDDQRGPVGPLKHLSKEVLCELLMVPEEHVEALWQHFGKRPGFGLDRLEEYADLVFLAFDATRRAGFTYDQLVAECHRKLEVNRARRWGKPSSDEPTEHVREGE